MSTALIVTTTNDPTAALRELSIGALKNEWRMIVVGDEKSPSTLALPGCEYLSLEKQYESGFALASSLPTSHYSRKNIGYLHAIRACSSTIVETDDDNFPRAAFYESREPTHLTPVREDDAWVNVYQYFTTSHIWPRGLPLDAIKARASTPIEPESRYVDCPIQQGLADGDPDVDAIYRLVLPLPQRFEYGTKIALGGNAWCPFNSQNTTWWPKAYPLLYLPSYCSFRMTDIWRSFVAQRILYQNGHHVLFHSPTVVQERNEHDLRENFRDEIPGYLNNDFIRRTLRETDIESARGDIPEQIYMCYRSLVNAGVFDERELELLDLWLKDVGSA